MLVIRCLIRAASGPNPVQARGEDCGCGQTWRQAQLALQAGAAVIAGAQQVSFEALAETAPSEELSP